MRYAVYAQWGKARHFTEAVVAGFPGRVRDIGIEHLAEGCVHVLGGLQFGCLELLAEIRRRREPYVFFDRAYFGGGTYTNRIRLTKNAYQQHWVGRADAARLARWNVRLAPWADAGEFVMVVPPGEAAAKLFDLEGWEAKTLARLSACTARRVAVSRKKDRDKSPLADRLRGCHAVVTWTSNVAVEALCLGVPAFVAPWSAAAPVCRRLDELETALEIPLRPAREAWAASLAAGQFTVDEIARGIARERLEENA